MKFKTYKILLPFAGLFQAGVWLRKQLYRYRIFKRIEFDVPVTTVGNLSVGGTGKTPMVEYLLELLENKHRAVLSRGYRRTTKGFRWVEPHDTFDQTGDEPLQIKQKYPNVQVAVCASRELAIPEIMAAHPDTEVVLLDDAMQYLAVDPGLTIMLTSYYRLFTEDLMLPAGHLREPRQAAERADMIVVTKCPSSMKEQEMKAIESRIQLFSRAAIGFATLVYGQPYDFFSKEEVRVSGYQGVVGLAGTASNEHFRKKVRQQFPSIPFHTYPDHHTYRTKDIDLFVKDLSRQQSPKAIFTTEKDAVRLAAHQTELEKHGIDLICQPVEMTFLKGGEVLEELITSKIEKNVS